LHFAELPVTIAHSIEAGGLPAYHRDPFDRMLVAQAQIEGLTLVTRDERLAAYGVQTLSA
jgi:PIN domain nuclease of toxin-antitoxin system